MAGARYTAGAGGPHLSYELAGGAPHSLDRLRAHGPGASGPGALPDAPSP